MTDGQDRQNGRRRVFTAGTHPRHPVFNIVLVDEGRSLKWLARGTGYSHQHVKNVAAGVFPATEAFRAKCAALLDRKESELFLTASISAVAEAVA